jgi:hypothetical protein
MPRISKTQSTYIYWLFDVRPQTLAVYPNGYPFYCGKTVMRPRARLNCHRSSGRKHPSRPISIKLRECGVYVRIQIMAEAPACETWGEQERNWIELEKCWIRTLRLLWPGAVNVSEGGSGAVGVVRSPEFRARLSAALKGKKRGPMSAEARANMSAGHKGKKRAPMSAEHRSKLSEAARNRSPEHRAKIGARFRGKKLTAERRAALSASLRGKKRGPYSAEHRAKISEAKRGKPGKPHSEETRAKMSAATRAHYDRLRAANAESH